MTSLRLHPAGRTALLAAALLVALCATTAAAQTNVFTYQGRLTDGNATANGLYDLQFALFSQETGGTQLTLTAFTQVMVRNGTFTVRLGNIDVESIFTGADRYLELAVRRTGSGANFTTLSPRQQITWVPYAYVALRAGELVNKEQYIRNSTSSQTPANFNISGDGILGGNMTVNGLLVTQNVQTSGSTVIADSLSVGNLGGGASTPLCANGGLIRFCSSSLRYKSEVQPFARGLEIVRRLRPISFTWKETGAHDLGLGAEEVAEVEPLLTFRNAQGQIEGVKYGPLNIVLINAIKQQEEQLERQQAQLERQQQQLDRLTRLLVARRHQHRSSAHHARQP